jgi:hypothetical protein
MDWIPPVHHKRSQNAGVVYSLVEDEAVLDAMDAHEDLLLN